MNDYPTQDTLEIEVKDFGPISKAKIDLRPLTVFVGPSNTGKSYLAILIYALHRYFSGSRWPSYWMFDEDGVRKLSRKTVGSLVEWARQTIVDLDKVRSEKSIVLPTPVMDVIRSGFNILGGYLDNEICRCFGIHEASVLIRKGNSDAARIAFRRRSKDSAPFEHELTIRSQETEFTETLAERVPMRIDVQDTDKLMNLVIEILETDRTDGGNDFETWQQIETLAGFALPQILSPVYLRAFYLPADRTGVMHAHSVVVSSMIESAPMAGLRPTPSTPMLSGVLADFLQQLIELNRPPYPRHKPRHDLSTQIEQAILDGSVRIQGLGLIDYPSFTYLPKGWKQEDDLPLMNASSMVSELAPVVLYLRYMVDAGNVLIVEEPESHLHPAMQVEFTRQLAELVRLGIRVIVTTHSEWVLDELANIVRRYELPKARQKKGIKGGDVRLRPDQVGAWLFQPKSRLRGSVVTEIGLDESGLYPSGFDDVAVALHNDWAKISSRIGEDE